MVADIGYISLLLSLLISIYVIFTYGLYLKSNNWRLLASAKGAVYSIGLLITLAVICLEWLLYTGDFSIKYVYKYTSTDLAWIYKLTALWAGNEGSLLLWAWLLVLYMVLIVKQNKIKEMTPIVLIILMINSLFFFLPWAICSVIIPRI